MVYHVINEAEEKARKKFKEPVVKKIDKTSPVVGKAKRRKKRKQKKRR